ncbi:threonine--tRNA ligase, partial [Sulfolobus sp. F3]
ERFKIEYTDKDGSKKRPVMVHRAILGSIDRCMAILLEHFMGKLPTWLSPIQVRILPITDEVNDYAEKLFNELKSNKIRVEISYAGETLSKRIKTAYDEGVPYLLIVGKKEANEGKVTVRGRGNVEIRNIKFEDFLNALKAEINDRDVEQSALKKLKG